MLIRKYDRTLIWIVFCISIIGCEETVLKESKFPDVTFSDENSHFAFTDLVEYEGTWWLAFRSSDKHVFGENGVIRVASSKDFLNWKIVATIEVDNIDLRDPDFYKHDGNLFLKAHGSIYEDGRLLGFKEYLTSISTNWSDLVEVNNGDAYWLWKVSSISGSLYTIGYLPDLSNPSSILSDVGLFEIDGGLSSKVCDLDLQGAYNEGTIKKIGEKNIIVVRNELGPLFVGEIDLNTCQLIDYNFPVRITGGPEFEVINDSEILIIGRYKTEDFNSIIAVVFDLNLREISSYRFIESGGDCGYAGIATDGDLIRLSYYSSHQGSSSIYTSILED